MFKINIEVVRTIFYRTSLRPLSYRLLLLSYIKYNPTFYVAMLEDYYLSLLGQTNLTLTPIIVNGEYEWDVEKIKNIRRKGRDFQYQIKWIGYENRTWESLRNLECSMEEIREFYKANPNETRPIAVTIYDN